MNPHRHLGSDEILARLTEGSPLPEIAGCAACEAEASSHSSLLSSLKLADSGAGTPTDWDDLLLRKRIREAVANEKPHRRSFFHGFVILKPAFVSAVIVALAVTVWSPLSSRDENATKVASLGQRLPAWTPLPDESEDEGLAVLLEWTPNEDELVIAGCRAACLAGLSRHEEENLLNAEGSNTPLATTAPSPL